MVRGGSEDEEVVVAYEWMGDSGGGEGVMGGEILCTCTANDWFVGLWVCILCIWEEVSSPAKHAHKCVLEHVPAHAVLELHRLAAKDIQRAAECEVHAPIRQGVHELEIGGGVRPASVGTGDCSPLAELSDEVLVDTTAETFDVRVLSRLSRLWGRRNWLSISRAVGRGINGSSP